MKDFQLNRQNFSQFATALQAELDETGYLVVSTQGADTGKWGMARLWRAWMSSTGDWMAGNGARMPLCVGKDGKWYGERAFDGNDAHELFTAQWLALDTDGNRLSWSRSGRDGMRAATKGERFIAMLKHQDWASERGIMLMKPRDSEFAKLEDEQNS